MSLLSALTASTLIFCAPGYPGGAGDAQPLLDQFASAAVQSAGWPAGSLRTVYDPTVTGGLAQLSGADAALAFVPYPFYYQYAAQLHLQPLVQADVADVGLVQRWTLVAKAGRTVTPAALGGYTILSVAGYAPDFVRKSALRDFALPADVKIEATAQILSALRRVAAGEPVVALLDKTQSAALPTLPFASQLQTVTQSPELPVALIARVDAHLSPAQAKSLEAGLLKMGTGGAAGRGGAGAGAGAGPGAGEAALTPLKLRGFAAPKLPADSPAVAP
jgi:hypothetical protein